MFNDVLMCFFSNFVSVFMFLLFLVFEVFLTDFSCFFKEFYDVLCFFGFYVFFNCFIEFSMCSNDSMICLRFFKVC